MRKILLGLGTVGLFFAATNAQAADVQYVLQTPGVTWGASSAKAREAVQALGVVSVETNMNDNSVNVVFDDEKTSIDDVISALMGAGYAVPNYSAVN
jgi:copper chaperone CopZ